MTLQFPITIKQGENTSIVFPVLDSTGALVTVDGWVGHAQVRRTPHDPVLYEWIASASNIIVAGQSVTLSILGSISLAWLWTSGRYDLFVTDLAGRPSCLAEGPFRVKPATTH